MLVLSNFSFCHNVFKSRLRHQKASICGKRLNIKFHALLFSKKGQDDSLTECITFNLGDDVILNSNPGSPDLFSSDEFVTEDNSGSLFNEIYEKENLQLFSVSNGIFDFFLTHTKTVSIINPFPHTTNLQQTTLI